MKKVLSVLLIVAMMCGVMCAVSAAETEFVPSINEKAAPELVQDENGNVGQLLDASGNVIDKSYIIIESAKGTRIRMQIGHDVYSPDAKALLRDVGDGKVHPPKGVGQEITLGTRKTGRSKYIIKSIDQVKKQVMLQENSGINKGKSVPEPITRRGKIRESERVRAQSQSSVSMDNGMMMGM